jgi:hypothetical protein
MATDEAIHDLLQLIKKQIELQEDANGIMRGLIDSMEIVAQETLELRKFLEKHQPIVK